MADVVLPEAGGAVRVGELTVEASGLSGTIGTASVTRGTSPLPEGLVAALERQGCGTGTPPLRVDARVTTQRSGAADRPRLRLHPPSATTRGAHDERTPEAFAVVVDDDGLVRWALPEPGRGGVVEVPLDPSAGEPTRGLVGAVVRKAIQWVTAPLVDRVVGAAGRAIVRRWEETNRPHRLRLVGDDLARPPDADVSEDDARRLLDGPTLLLIHGTMSSAASGFAGLAPHLGDLRRLYGGRVLAFDHPTLGVDPDANARWLAERLRRLVSDPGSLTLDVVGHSRGGLVARVLAERRQAIGLPLGLVEVRSVTFAGTPNAGTPLCDVAHLGDLLDTYTNLLALLPDGGVSDAIDVVVAVARQLATGVFAGLDGATAMDPGGAWLRELNRPADATTTYRALTADYEPPHGAGRMRRLRDAITDRVFARDANDLVVPTAGTVADNGSSLFPIDSHLRLEPTAAGAVDHFHFFANPASVAQLRAWLLADDVGIDRTSRPRPAPVTVGAPRTRTSSRPPSTPAIRPGGDHSPIAAVDEALANGDVDRLRRAIATLDDDDLSDLEHSIGAPVAAVARRAATSDKRPGTVIVLPGIMGSNLDVVEQGDADRVWLQLWRLLTGQFRRLRHPEHDGVTVRAAGLHRAYIPLLLSLGDQFTRVDAFAYDWRLPLARPAARLTDRINRLLRSTDGPVHVVAHSMGGLVARHMLARSPEVWARAAGRLVQLGTPNRGSYAIVPVLTGDDRIVSWLAAGDMVEPKADILDVIRGFPAVYELLPSPMAQLGDDHAAIFDLDNWPPDAPDAMGDLLTNARQAHEQLAAARHPADDMAMVLGTDRPTPFRLRLDGGVFRYGRTLHGDGRVPHELARLPGVATWYSTASHGDLVTDGRVLAALPALLAGEQADLPEVDVVSSRASAVEALDPALPVSEIVTPVPTPAAGRDAGVDAAHTAGERIDILGDVTTDWLGAHGTTRRAKQGRPLDVDVAHGLLQRERGPWMIGHVAGTPLTGAEAAVNAALDGALSRHHLVHEYPERVGDPLVVAHPVGDGYAIVVGLGEWGELTAPQLSEAVTRGVLRYLVTPAAAAVAVCRLSTVLIGSAGDAGLTIPQTVAAVTTGVLAANRQAADLRTDTGLPPAVEHLRFVERYEERAIVAATAVRRLTLELDPQSVGDTDLRPASVLQPGLGGEPGQPPPDAGDDTWRRLVVRAEEDQLALTLLGRRAVAPQSVHGLLRDVERMIGQPGTIPRVEADWLVMLWHLLVPAELRHGLYGNLQLALDERAAGLPWEMLATQDRTGAARPLGLRVGLVRQLVDLHADTRLMTAGAGAGGGNALIIGDPPTQRYPRLAGARREAGAVADQLADVGMDVHRLIFDETDTADRSGDILTALYSRPWEIVHIAAHGQHDPRDPHNSGVIIGPDQTLRGEHIASLSSTPRFVALNCCHLARVDGELTVAGTPATRTSLPRFAASIARALMRQGVHAVVAAGWAVDDGPAMQFAVSLYEQLLGGAPYGRAVQVARQRTHALQPSSATWGAYQCYGTAGFQMRPAVDGSTQVTVVGRSQLARELHGLATRCTVSRTCQDLQRELADLLATAPVEWREEPECMEAIAQVLADMGAFDEAVSYYRRAAEHHEGGVTVRAIQQLANLQSRVGTLDLDEISAWLDWLERLGPTTEREALRGAALKRRAAMLKTPAARLRNAEEALAHYRKALELAHDDLYVLPNVLQLEAILGQPIAAEDRRRLDGLADEGHRPSFWRSATAGDMELVDYLAGAQPAVDGIGEAYLAALETDPTHREWASVVEQCRTLGAIRDDEQLIALAARLELAPEQRRARLHLLTS